MPTHPVAALDVRDFGAETVRVGDLNGDGAPDFLFAQDIRGPRTITCLTATTIAGEVLYLYDLDGRGVWQRPQPPGSWAAACVEIDWSGHGEPREVVVYSRGAGNAVAVYDGKGDIVDEVRMQYTPDRTEADRATHHYVTRADVWGDRREEIILFGARGACVWSNARPLAIPTLYNNTLYPGM